MTLNVLPHITLIQDTKETTIYHKTRVMLAIKRFTSATIVEVKSRDPAEV